MARRPVTFFCFAKRKSPKKRRPAVWVPTLRFGQPALLDSGGGPQNSPSAQTTAALIPPPSALLGPARTGQAEYKYKKTNTNANKDSPWRILVEFGLRYSAVCFQPPSVCAEEHRARRIRAGTCLSRRRVCARPRLDRAPQVARSEAQGRRQQGRLFFGDFLLAKQKKVTSRRATPGQLPSASPLKPGITTSAGLPAGAAP